MIVKIIKLNTSFPQFEVGDSMFVEDYLPKVWNINKKDLNECYEYLRRDDLCTEGVYIICPNCGAEYSVSGTYMDLCLPNYYKITSPKYKIAENIFNKSEKLKKEVSYEISKANKIKRCLVCEAKLSEDYPFRKTFKDFMRYDTLSRVPIDWEYKRRKKDPLALMKDNITEICENNARNDTDLFIKNADVKVVSSNKTKNEINTDTLKEYVLNLVNLESNIFFLSKRLRQLYLKRIYNNKDVAFQQYYPLYEKKQDIIQDIEAKSSDLEISKKKYSDLEKQPISIEKKKYPSKPLYPVLKTAYFFNRKKVEAENSEKIHNYELSLEKYNSDVNKIDAQNEKMRIDAQKQKEGELEELNGKIETVTNELSILQTKLKQKTGNQIIPTKALGEKQLLDDEIKTTEEMLIKLFQCRNELYSYNIIFEKYRNIVALSTFYEYLMAGRCETLEGVNGAYNIYENELRLNTIITKLDEIKENQYMIYSKLVDVETSLGTLNNTMEKAVSSLDRISQNTSDMKGYLDKISKNTAVIAHNSAVTAHYTKVNAELTNALGFMVALK